MKISAHMLIPLLSVAAACGGSGSTTTAVSAGGGANTQQSMQLATDHEIVALVYDNLYSVPNGFFVDERATTNRSYTVHHVLDPSGSYELCTDDLAVAMAWDDADNASRNVQGYYVESYENARYFEFVRELSYENDIGNIDELTSPGFSRIFKCSHTNRDGVDRALLSGYAGTLSSHPLSDESIRIFAEYLWQFTYFPNSRKVVLANSGSQSDDELHHVLQLAFSSNQGTGNCDLIEVAQWRFSADRAGGQVNKNFEIIRSFEAKIDNGSAVLCD